MRIEYYINRADRKSKIEAARQANERLLHDDFIDEQGNPTDGKSGRLTFDVEVFDLENNRQRLLKILEKRHVSKSINEIPEDKFRYYVITGIAKLAAGKTALNDAFLDTVVQKAISLGDKDNNYEALKAQILAATDEASLKALIPTVKSF